METVTLRGDAGCPYVWLDVGSGLGGLGALGVVTHTISLSCQFASRDTLG